MRYEIHAAYDAVIADACYADAAAIFFAAMRAMRLARYTMRYTYCAPRLMMPLMPRYAMLTC